MIAHEVGHVIENHHDERITRQVLAQQTLGIGAAVAGNYGQLVSQGGGMLAQAGFLLPNSRDQEREADVVGQRLMAGAGFDPRAAVGLWQNMIAASGGNRPPPWLSTHPNPQSRISELQARAAEPSAYEQARKAGRRALRVIRTVRSDWHSRRSGTLGAHRRRMNQNQHANNEVMQ